jgi:hypothetical protein
VRRRGDPGGVGVSPAPDLAVTPERRITARARRLAAGTRSPPRASDDCATRTTLNGAVCSDDASLAHPATETLSTATITAEVRT